MKISRALAVVCAATLAPLALAVPAAHADQTYTGELTEADPKVSTTFPESATDSCSPYGSGTPPMDTVSFVSTTDGPRSFVLRETDSAPGVPVLWVYLNGTCVAADVGDDGAEADGVTAVEGVQVAKGATVEVRISDLVSYHHTWTLSVLQPGSANSAAVGKATRYVALPEQVVCATGTAAVTLTKKARKAAKKGGLEKIVFTAGGVKVAAVKAKRLKRAVKKGVLLRGIPQTATSIDVVAKLENGKKKRAARPYSSC